MNNVLEISITGNNSDLKKSLQDSRAELKKFAEEVKRGGGDVKTAMASERLEGQKLTNAMKEVRLESARLALEKKKTAGAVTAASGSYREAQQRLTALGKSIREAAGGFTNTSPAIRKQIQEYNQLNNKLKEFDKTMGNNYRNVGNYGSAFAGAIPVIGQFTSVAGLATAAVAGVQKSFEYNMKLDAFKTALKEVSRDSSDFDKNLKFLRDTSERLGLDFMTVADSFKLWNGAAKFSNLTADESRKIFESVANAGAKMKLSSDDVRGSLLALSQMLSKGKVSAEELRQQLGERMPQAFALAVKASGKTEAEFNKLLETGKIISGDFLPKFADELDKAFGNDKNEKIQSMQAEVTRLSNAWNDLFESDSATTFFTDVAKGLTELVTEFDRTINSKSWKEFFLRLGGGITTGITSALMGAGADSQRYANQVTPLQRAVNRNVGSFSDLNNEQKKLKLQEQQALVTRLSKQYNERKDKETLDRLTYQNATLAEMNKLYYGQLETKKKINTLDDDGKKPKGKSQADLIKEANEALRGGQIDNLKGIDNELAKIDKKWDGILEKVNKVTNEGLKNQLKAQVEQGRELDKQLAKLDVWAKSSKLKAVGVAPGTITPTLSSIPSIDGLINSRAGRTAQRLPDMKFDDEFSRYVKGQLRRGISSISSTLLSDFTSINQGVFEVEKKYNDLRRDATKEQIEALNKMEQIEKRINNGLSNLLINVTKTFSSVGAGILSSAISEGISSGDFSDLRKMFSGNNRAMGYGALGSLVGSTVQGLSKQTSALGQGLGGVLSGAGTGAMIGSIIPGIGTAIGAAVGGIVGGIGGLLGSKKAREQERLQQEQLAESKRQTLLQERIAQLSYTSSIVGQRTNLGTVTGIDRDEFGNVIARIEGKDIVLAYDRNK